MRERAFFRDMLTYLPSRLLPALTGLISAPILTRLFLPEEYAQYALALGVSDFLFALAISGIASIPVRFLPACDARSEKEHFYGTISLFSGLIVLAICALGLALLQVLRELIPATLAPLLRISLLIFIFQSLFSIFMDAARAQERSGLYTTFELLYRYGSLGCGLLLVVVAGLHVEGLLWGEALALALATPFLIRLTTHGNRLRPSSFRADQAVQMWRYAWPLSLGNTAMWGLRLSDRFIIGLFRPAEEIGQYALAHNLSSRSVDLLVALVLLTAGPVVMNAWEKEGPRSAETALALATRTFILLGLPAVAGLALLSQPLVRLMTTEPYYAGSKVIGLVAFSSFAWGLSLLASYGPLLRKNTKRIAINQLLAATTTVLLNFLLVPPFGFVAAGASAALGFLFLAVLQARTSQRLLAWSLPLGSLRNALLAVAAMSAYLLALAPLFRSPSVPLAVYLLIAIAGAVPIYFAALLLLGEASPQEKHTLRKLARRATRAHTADLEAIE